MPDRMIMSDRMIRLAGIDCGTNSIRLLIADVDGDDRLLDVEREMRVVRLGQDVDRTGRLAAPALERTRAALADYARTIADTGAVRTRMVATSATRDAANRDEFTAMVRSVLGVDPEVIDGREEATLSFQGAVAGLPAVRPPLLVADIGGGSTELVLGAEESVQCWHSMDVGCVRLTERHLRDDPPTRAQVTAVMADLEAALERASRDVPLQAPAAFVGVAGTVTTIAAIALALDRYDAERIHGAVIGADQVREVTERLLAMTHAERARLPVMHPGRVDVIGGGALVLRSLLDATGAPAVVASEHDILDGIVLGLAKSSSA
jgi:exopolyphosphatase/guanosine-5'-triphosphate,3'-diphosphate pyrophosphatase